MFTSSSLSDDRKRPDITVIVRIEADVQAIHELTGASDSSWICCIFAYSIIWVVPAMERFGVIYGAPVDVLRFVSSQERTDV